MFQVSLEDHGLMGTYVYDIPDMVCEIQITSVTYDK